MSVTRLILAGLTAVALPAVADANPTPLSVRDSFTIGNREGIECAVQAQPLDPAAPGTFDRAYTITCRDAAAAVGRLYALRGGSERLAPLAKLRASKADCQPGTQRAESGVLVTACKLRGSGADYSVYQVQSGRTLYVAEGLKGYDDALKLALRSAVSDRVVPGAIVAAATSATDAAAFARAQAQALDPQAALAEAYRRNNGGAYAESAEFFDVLASRGTGEQGSEALLGAALQQSNLGAYAAADALIARVPAVDRADPVTGRVARNVIAIQYLNQGRPRSALEILEKPLPSVAASGPARASAGRIDAATAAALNRRARIATDPDKLTPQERAQILDIQLVQLRGSARRLMGDNTGAQADFDTARAELARVAAARAVSIARLESATLAEVGRLQEAQGNLAAAEQWQRQAIAAIETEFPGSLADLAARARLAAILAKRGQTDPSLALYREVVAAAAAAGSPVPGVGANLPAYFELLAKESSSRPALVEDFFAAAQLLVRPGVAQTQAVLARELSGGSDEAARLFRQSVDLTRDVERVRVELGRLNALAELTPEQTVRRTELTAELDRLSRSQVETTAQLAAFPRYKAVATATLTLTDLQRALRPGEAYLKISMAGPTAWGLIVSPTAARIYRLGATPAELATRVADLRSSIVQIDQGQTLTPPFDAELASRLYADVLGTVAPELRQVTHLIYEPDGALLKLPLTLLIEDPAGVADYRKRADAKGGDPFDMRNLAWIGRRMEISTAVAALAFRDLRATPPSSAKRPYLGFGQNALPSPAIVEAAAKHGGLVGSVGEGCGWPIAQWSQPISNKELVLADKLLGGGPEDVVSGAAFTDRAILTRADLSSYRILHFATHGLVTPPKAGCPASPALITSFGDRDSDGLLSFAEVFDMRLNADLVVLSACDTAGEASAAAARSAGVASGGEFALDGLVRAFVGAGSRTIVASHWPVPDDYNATGRLISSLFTAPAGTGVGAALRHGQLQLMNAAETSHPFYWAAFAVIGDGTRPVTPK